MTLVRLPAVRDLARLPDPFFDPRERQLLRLPFVIDANPDDDALQSAGMVASWFGQQADFRGATFPVAAAAPATGNAVVIATADKVASSIALPKILGPTVAVLPNPNDAHGSLLLVTGRTSAEVVSAAQSLVLGSRALAGEVAPVTAPTITQRAPYDAPAWIATDRLVKLGELVDAVDLQASGYVPGALRVPFRTAPDLYTWRNHGLPLEIRYRAPLGPVLDVAVSRLDVGVNNLYVASLPLGENPIGNGSWLPAFLNRDAVRQVTNVGDESVTKSIDVPIFGVFGKNELQFYFDARPLHRGDCIAIPSDPRMSVDPDSTIDLRRAGRMASLPNLSFFVSSGFPFSRMADLSETAVVVPQQPTGGEIQTYLELLGRIGAFTGFPAVRVAVVRPDEVSRVADRDLLMVGSLPHLRGAAELLRNSPFRMADKSVEIQFGSPLGNIRQVFGGESAEKSAQLAIQTAAVGRFSAIIGTESPLRRGRSIVAVVASDSDALDGVVPLIRNDEQAAKIQGDLAILTGGNVTSFRVGETYNVGHLSPWLYLSWILGDSPIVLAAALLIGAALLASLGFRALRRQAGRRMSKTGI